MVGWLVGRWVGRLVDWLVGWLVACLDLPRIETHVAIKYHLLINVATKYYSGLPRESIHEKEVPSQNFLAGTNFEARSCKTLKTTPTSLVVNLCNKSLKRVRPEVLIGNFPGTNTAISDQFSITFSAGTPLCTYGIAFRRAYGSFTYAVFKKSLSSPLYGQDHFDAKIAVRHGGIHSPNGGQHCWDIGGFLRIM